MNIFKFNLSLPSAGESIKAIFSSPTIYITFFAVIILIVALLYVSRAKITTKVLIHVAIAIALGTVLKMFRIMAMPMGGSVTLGSMIPIIFISYLYGARIGILSGIVFGILDLLFGAYVVHPIQFLLDYILAFGALGVAGYFRKSIALGAFFAIFLRFVFHVISGIVFFASYAGKQNVIIYSILYNGTYLLPEAIISVIILSIIPLKRMEKEIQKSMQ